MSCENRRPVIGVLSQEVAYKLECIYGVGTFHSYIAASYVKFLECSGARVVPISIGKDRKYYESLMSKINGVLFPGGATYLTQTDGYADAGKHIYKIAVDLNAQGDYFPLWGTCLGFELMPYLWMNVNEEFRGNSSPEYQVSNLNFEDDFKSSKLFGSAPDDVITSLSKSKVTFNSHKFCITPEIFEHYKMGNEWKILSKTNDSENICYISSMESISRPFFGVQFHPEKSQFEGSWGGTIAHSREAVNANRYFADFFVDECRKSTHRFSNEEEEDSYNIFNFTVTYTKLRGSTYEQCYLFKHDKTEE